jgi:hypothetical protein
LSVKDVGASIFPLIPWFFSSESISVALLHCVAQPCLTTVGTPAKLLDGGPGLLAGVRCRHALRPSACEPPTPPLPLSFLRPLTLRLPPPIVNLFIPLPPKIFPFPLDTGTCQVNGVEGLLASKPGDWSVIKASTDVEVRAMGGRVGHSLRDCVCTRAACSPSNCKSLAFRAPLLSPPPPPPPTPDATLSCSLPCHRPCRSNKAA